MPLTVTAAASPDPALVELINGPGYDWGNLVVQLLIAAATLGTLVWAIRTTRNESNRASRERTERLAFEEVMQASKVSAWERQSYDPKTQTETRVLLVQNGSDAPIYDVAVEFDDYSRMELLAEEDGSDSIWRSWVHALLPPEPDPRSIEVGLVPANCGAISDDAILSVEFCDGAGKYWLRDREGKLHRRKDLDHLDRATRYERRMMKNELPVSYESELGQNSEYDEGRPAHP